MRTAPTKNLLRAARKRRGLTLQQVEQITAISRIQLWRYEYGLCEPVVSTAIKLARLYRLPVESLFASPTVRRGKPR